MQVTISKRSGTKIAVSAPYNSLFVRTAKMYGGKWVVDEWVFDARDEQRVRDLCIYCYGSDGLTTDVVTLRVTFSAGDDGHAEPISIHGRTIAKASGRDSGAKLGDGIVLLKGAFGSGGSVKNWRTTVQEGTVVLVRDFPRAVALELMKDPDMNIQIEEEAAPVDMIFETRFYDALRDERDRLVSRLEVIYTLLAQEPRVEMNTTQRFVNGVEKNREHPDTFEIPTDEEKAGISPGDSVKVGFIAEGQEDGGERMWLAVTAITPEGLIEGTLDNDPVVVSHKCGDRFTVSPDHVLNIIKTDGVVH